MQWRWVVLWMIVLSLTGCAGYASFIQGLKDRELTSCVHGNLVLGFPIGNGAVEVYSATGGESVNDCIGFFKNLPVAAPVVIPGK